MDYKEYEKYINERMRIKAENERRIKEKFSECEKWVADNLVGCGCVFTNHAENLQKQGFMIWIDRGYNISHKWYNLKDCGIAPLDLLPYPDRK